MALVIWTVGGLVAVTMLSGLARLSAALVRVRRLGGFSPGGIPAGWFDPESVEGRVVWWGQLSTADDDR